MTTPRELSSRYELGEILGFGGMSEVHLARDVRLGREVAIKVLRQDLARDPTFYLRFRREAQNAAALNHPAIVAVYDTGEAETESGPLPYIVMEYVDGDTLRDIVRSEGPMAPKRAMEVIADVCAALDFSHRNGIVHRDVKPANIMINRAGAVKVMDFGIARAIADASSPMTQTAAVIGTAQYLSPEQARGEQVDARSDVYSLGCVLFEILTGQPPFSGDSPVAVAYQHVREDPPLPSSVNPDVPGELDAVILRAMSKNPANRYQSAADMRSDLVRVLGGQRPSAPMVLSEEDRTSYLGAAVTTQVPRTPDAPRPAYRPVVAPAREAPTRAARRHAAAETKTGGRRGVRIALLALGALIVVGIVGAFLYALGPGAAPKQITLPSVAGQSAAQAQTALTALGVTVDVRQSANPTVPQGTAIGTQPTTGTSVEPNSTVILEVSSGPEQVSVPNVTGLSQQEATTTLTAAGFTVEPTVARATSSREDQDKVVLQDPAVGASAAKGSAVKLTLGSGPEQVRVPDVTGQSLTVAQGNLTGAGFEIKVETIDSPAPNGTVVNTDPAGGTQGGKGDTVTVRVSNGSQFTMPALVGLTPAQAVDVLRAAGWTGTATDLVQIPMPTLDATATGRVTDQKAPQGAAVPKTGPLEVSIGKFGI